MGKEENMAKWIPNFIGRCGCGNLLIMDCGASLGSEYWAKSVSLVEATEKMDLPKIACPLHGGSTDLPIGNFYYREAVA